jgi:hypothetical protein
MTAGQRLEIGESVELLHSHAATQSHWSSGSTVCFPPRPRWKAVCVPGMHPHFWIWDLLLAMSRYSMNNSCAVGLKLLRTCQEAGLQPTNIKLYRMKGHLLYFYKSPKYAYLM